VAVPLNGAVLVIPERVNVARLKLGKMLRRQVAREQRRLQKHHERRGRADAAASHASR
jgi:hypothetical protein